MRARGRGQVVGTSGGGRDPTVEGGSPCSEGGTQREASPRLGGVGARRWYVRRIDPRGGDWRLELAQAGGIGPGARTAEN